MKTVIEMAREAGVRIYNEHTGRNTEKTFIAAFDILERFAELVRAETVTKERESCAYRAGIALLGADRGLANRVDKAIRARSNT